MFSTEMLCHNYCYDDTLKESKKTFSIDKSLKAPWYPLWLIDTFAVCLRERLLFLWKQELVFNDIESTQSVTPRPLDLGAKIYGPLITRYSLSFSHKDLRKDGFQRMNE